VYASLAEMASILPVAGAEYHWAAMFAPPKWRSVMSYVQGTWKKCTEKAFGQFH